MSFRAFEMSPWWASLVGPTVKNLPAMQETQVPSLGQDAPRENGMAPYSSILAWRIPWTGEPGGLESMGSQRARHNSVTDTHSGDPWLRTGATAHRRRSAWLLPSFSYLMLPGQSQAGNTHRGNRGSWEGLACVFLTLIHINAAFAPLSLSPQGKWIKFWMNRWNGVIYKHHEKSKARKKNNLYRIMERLKTWAYRITWKDV